MATPVFSGSIQIVISRVLIRLECGELHDRDNECMNTAQKLEFLRNTLDRMMETVEELSHRDPLPHVDKYFQDKIEEWVSKILGVTSGYEAEFRQMYKHRMEKMRNLYSGHGDVTVGDPDELHAKTIQLKSTIGDFSQVNSMIKVALNQLSGERGEMPREKDRLVVDMNILNADNTWPGGAGTLGDYDWQQYQQRVCAQIESLCAADSYRQHGSQVTSKRKGKTTTKEVEGFGLSPAIRQHLTDTESRQLYSVSKIPMLNKPHSSQVLSHSWGHHPSQGEKVIHLTFKIRYFHGYPVRGGFSFQTGQTTYYFLHLVKVNVFRTGDRLVARPTQLVFFNGDGYVRHTL